MIGLPRRPSRGIAGTGGKVTIRFGLKPARRSRAIRIRPEIAKGGRAGDIFLPDALVPKLRKFWAYKRARGGGAEYPVLEPVRSADEPDGPACYAPCFRGDAHRH